ncbi:MAG: CooT family nickel-binding protein [Methanothrix sp.]
MCEFTVYLEENGSSARKKVAKNIVVARRRDGKILLMDAFGSTIPIENAIIDEANTFTQEMILKTA